MSASSNFYQIHTGNFFYEPNQYINSLHRNYYYPNNTNSNTNINNYTYNKRDNNYFNTRTKSSNYNLYSNELNDINNFKFDLSHKNINFNKRSDKKIKLTYEFENISPNEITDKTKELINLQSQMCSLDTEDNKKAKSSKNRKNKIKNKIKQLSRTQKTIKSGFFSGLTTYKTKNYKNIKRNYTYDELLNSNNKFKISINNNISKIKKSNTIKKNMIKIWKDKCNELDEEIIDVKNKIKILRNQNSILTKRINLVKEKEDKKYLIYDKALKTKKYNGKLVEKLKLSEEIKAKQIELIIKMQKEVNNMRLKLHMLGES